MFIRSVADVFELRCLRDVVLVEVWVKAADYIVVGIHRVSDVVDFASDEAAVYSVATSKIQFVA